MAVTLLTNERVSSDAEAEKVAEAFNGALEKLHRALDTDIAKMRDKSNRDTIRTGNELDSEA